MPGRRPALLSLVLAALVACVMCGPTPFVAFAPPPAPAVVAVSGTGSPFRTYDKASGNETGFEVALREALCALASLDCQVLNIVVQERINVTSNGTADWVIGTLSFSNDRAKVVDYVRPFYYSSGVGLFALDGNHILLQESGGWEALRDRPLCLRNDYYANTAILKQYGPTPVYFTSQAEGIAKVLAGECDAIAFDNVAPDYITDGVSLVSNIAPILRAPYGVAVTKGNDDLARRLSAALVELMSSGDRSPILTWEEDYLLSEEVPPSQELSDLVDYITYME